MSSSHVSFAELFYDTQATTPSSPPLPLFGKGLTSPSPPLFGKGLIPPSPPLFGKGVTSPPSPRAGRRFPASDDSADNRVHYDVDLYRNVDVFHFPIDQAVPVDPTSSAAPSEDTPLQAGRRGGRHMSFEESDLDRSLTVSGDVVAEAQEHLRKARALPQVRRHQGVPAPRGNAVDI